MKRLLYIISAVAVLSAFFPIAADAQHFGVKAGINFSDPKADVKTNLGYQAGLLLQYDMPFWFSVQPELLFHVKGSQVSKDANPFGLGYLELPVNVQWGPQFNEGNIRVFLQGSPFIGYAISKDLKNPKGEQYSWENVNRFEYGVGAGLGIQFWHFQLSAQYNWTFSNIVRSNQSVDSEFTKNFSNANFGGYTVSLAIIF